MDYHYTGSGGVILSGECDTRRYMADGGLILSGSASINYTPDFHFVPEDGFILGGTSYSEPLLEYEQDFTWNIDGTITVDFAFRWDLGQQALHYYTVEGACQTPPTCDITGIETNDDNCSSGGARFTQTIAARNLSDLCNKLKELFLTFPVKWPIVKIRRHSRPVYLTDINFSASPNTTLSRLADGTLISISIQPTQTVVTTIYTSGQSVTNIIATTDSNVITDVLPDGTVVRTTLTNGVVNTVNITKPDGTVHVQRSDSILVMTTAAARDATLSGQIGSQLVGLDENCNILEDQIYCAIPECLEFCVDEYHVVGISASSSIQDVFFNYVASGGLSLQGQAGNSIADLANGGFTLGGSATVTSNYFSYLAGGGLILSGSVEYSANHWTHVAGGGLILEGEAPPTSPAYKYSAEGGLTLSGLATSRQAIEIESSGGLILSSSGTSNYIPKFQYTSSGGLTLGGTATKTSNVYSMTGGGGLTFSGVPLIVSPDWHYLPDDGLTFSGSYLLRRRESATGGFAVSSSSPHALRFTYVPSGGVTLGGSGLIGNAPSFHHISSGGFTLSGDPEFGTQNMGTLEVGIEGLSSLELMETVLPAFDLNTVPLSPDTGTVNTNCGCGSVPIKLRLQHNLGEGSILQDFLFRNNLTLPSVVNLTYNRYDDMWKAAYHFKGVGSDSAIEKWILVFEWSCDDSPNTSNSKVWKMSALVTRIKSSPFERNDTRILYSFQTQDACDDNEISLAFVVDTNTLEFVSPPITPVEQILADEIGLFDGKNWRKTHRLKINVTQNDLITSANTVDIFPIFPVIP